MSPRSSSGTGERVKGLVLAALVLVFYFLVLKCARLIGADPVTYTFFADVAFIVIASLTYYAATPFALRGYDDSVRPNRKVNPVLALLVVVVGFAVMFQLSMALYQWSYIHLSSENFNLRAEAIGDGSSPLFIALSVLIAPVVEELLFRGLVQKSVSRLAGIRVGLVIQALLFALYHMSSIQFAQTFIVGLFLGVLAARSESLLPAMLAHCANNAILTFFPDAATVVPVLGVQTVLLVVTALFVVACVVFVKPRAAKPPQLTE